jgi:hypothetical protein
MICPAPEVVTGRLSEVYLVHSKARSGQEANHRVQDEGG